MEGEKVVTEALGSLKAGLEQLIVGESFLATRQSWLRGLKFPFEKISVLSDKDVSWLSGMHTPPGVFAVAKRPMHAMEFMEQENLAAYFYGVSDPGNLGTMLRTAEWFGIKTVVVAGDGVDPYNEKVVRAAMGSLFRLNVVIGGEPSDDLRILKRQGFTLLATDVHGNSAALPSSAKICLIMGSESHGLPHEVMALADRTYTIPGFGQAESLNVAVSFGIVLHHIRTLSA